MMEALVGGSEDRLVDSGLVYCMVDNGLVDGMVDNGLVDGMVDNWCRLRHWDDTAAHLPGKLHRDLPARVSSELILFPGIGCVSMTIMIKSFFNMNCFLLTC